MKTAIRRMGNSQGVIIPKPLLAEIGAKAGDMLDMKVERGKIVIAPIKRKVRQGWAEASKARSPKRARVDWYGRNSGTNRIRTGRGSARRGVAGAT